MRRPGCEYTHPHQDLDTVTNTLHFDRSHEEDTHQILGPTKYLSSLRNSWSQAVTTWTPHLPDDEVLSLTRYVPLTRRLWTGLTRRTQRRVKINPHGGLETNNPRSTRCSPQCGSLGVRPAHQPVEDKPITQPPHGVWHLEDWRLKSAAIHARRPDACLGMKVLDPLIGTRLLVLDEYVVLELETRLDA